MIDDNWQQNERGGAQAPPFLIPLRAPVPIKNFEQE